MRKVLVVDDDALVTASLVAHLEAARLTTRVAADARAGARAWRSWRPDVVVLDIVLPGRSGLDLLRRMRKESAGARVVLLSALGSTDDRIAGLETGADDYVTKPFSVRELVLRVEALLRRTDQPVTRSAGPLGPVVLDPSTRSARLAGRSRQLTPREFDLLEFLARHEGMAFSSRELLHHVWGWDFGDDSTVAVHVRRLRQKFEPDPSSPALLTTVRGTGYRLATVQELGQELGRARGQDVP